MLRSPPWSPFGSAASVAEVLAQGAAACDDAAGLHRGAGCVLAGRVRFQAQISRTLSLLTLGDADGDAHAVIDVLVRSQELRGGMAAAAHVLAACTLGALLLVEGFFERLDTGDLCVHAVALALEAAGTAAGCLRTDLPGDSALGAPGGLGLQGHGWKRVRNGDRAARFVEALLGFFGRELLAAGPVLDVAGGGGDGLGVAFELEFRRGLQAVVVDPRPVSQRGRGKQLSKLHFRKRCLGALAPGAAFSPLARRLAQDLSRTAEDFAPQQVCDAFGADFAASERGRGLLEACSVVVGMHPDQATHPIVEIATALRKPWAVVPCCVFPKANPNKCLADGRLVRTYDDLCGFLAARCPGVQEVSLPFEGRSRAFFWRP